VPKKRKKEPSYPVSNIDKLHSNNVITRGKYYKDLGLTDPVKLLYILGFSLIMVGFMYLSFYGFIPFFGHHGYVECHRSVDICIIHRPHFIFLPDSDISFPLSNLHDVTLDCDLKKINCRLSLHIDLEKQEKVLVGRRTDHWSRYREALNLLNEFRYQKNQENFVWIDIDNKRWRTGMIAIVVGVVAIFSAVIWALYFPYWQAQNS